MPTYDEFLAMAAERDKLKSQIAAVRRACEDAQHHNVSGRTLAAAVLAHLGDPRASVTLLLGAAAADWLRNRGDGA